MILVILRFLLLAASAMVGFSASAQHPLILNKLNTWNAASPQPPSEIIEGQLASVVKSIYAEGHNCTDSDILIDTIQPATADRYVFNGLVQGRVRNGWFVSIRQPECDSAPSRFMIIQNVDDSFRTIRVNRGVSYAWESLIGDTFPLAKVAAISALKRAGVECATESRATLGVVRIAAAGEGLGNDTFGIRYSGAWDEIWPIELCERTVEVFVSFRADGDGGAYMDLLGDKARVVP